MGSTARDGERCTYRLLIWTRIDYRQSDAQEFLLPSYFHFVRILEAPCKRFLIVACSVHDGFVVLFVDYVYFFIVKNCDAYVVAEHDN